MSSAVASLGSYRPPMEVLNEKLHPLTREEKKATAIALQKLIENKDYRRDAPQKLMTTLDEIKSALEHPENYVENPHYKITFMVELLSLIQAKIKELNSLKKEEATNDCILS